MRVSGALTSPPQSAVCGGGSRRGPARQEETVSLGLLTGGYRDDAYACSSRQIVAGGGIILGAGDTCFVSTASVVVVGGDCRVADLPRFRFGGGVMWTKTTQIYLLIRPLW